MIKVLSQLGSKLSAKILIIAFLATFWPFTAAAELIMQFDISAETTGAVDIAYANFNYYVVDGTDNLVYEYDIDGEYVGVFIDPSGDGATESISIAYDPFDERFFVLDSGQKSIYVYDSTGVYDEQFDISEITGTPFQLAWDDNTGHILVLELTSDTAWVVHEFNGSGISNGDTFDITSQAGFITGLAASDGYMWVTDDTSWDIKQLDRNTGISTSFTLDVSEEGVGNPTGLEYIDEEGGILAFIDSGTVFLYTTESSGSGSGIPATDDDSYFEGGGWLSSVLHDYLAQGNDSGTTVLLALRFLEVGVAQGAAISSATITLRVANFGGSAGALGYLYGSDIDDAPAWDNSIRPDTITKTTASSPVIAYSGVAGTLISVDVTDIVQEIVNRSGWVSGNNLAFGGDATDATGFLYLVSSENSLSTNGDYSIAPKLIIETGDGGGELDPPARELRLQGGVRLMGGVHLY